ncbi:LysR family transcriptional regulator [Rhizobium sullae]|uniref:LysR family transcriptional regulator n=1 Tax=Rhizobium sullae TaxID=50338 RepID=UPI0010456105|nr:LysR family transcriptional regulator [Rhizobium sullae]
MPNLALDLRYLKYAIVVAEQGSFRRAADILNLPQSTVSRRIQILERTLGLPLFERSRIGARPTLAGERFIREAATLSFVKLNRSLLAGPRIESAILLLPS